MIRPEIVPAWRKRPTLFRWLLIALVSALYWALVCSRATKKILWTDELFTYYLATCRDLGSMWAVLRTADPSPPMTYLLTRAAVHFLGARPIALRLPSIFGYWLAGLCLYFFVAKRTNGFFGSLSVLFLGSTVGALYAFDAKPYALLLGFCAAALLFWQIGISAGATANRGIALCGLSLSLAAAISTHYFAVTLFVAIGAAELVRTLLRRTIDVWTWVAIAVGTTPGLLLFPFIRAAKGFQIPYWAEPEWGDAPRFYVSLLGLALLPAVAVLIGFCLRGSATRDASHASAWEWTALFGLALAPVLATVLAKSVHTALAPRYALPCVIGCAGLVGFALYARRSSKALVAVTASIVGVVCAVNWRSSGGLQFMMRPGEPIIIASEAKPLPEAAIHSDLPVVISDAQRFLQIGLYGPRALQDRAVFLVDPNASMKHIHMNNGDAQMTALSRVAPIRVESYGTFLRGHSSFLFYGARNMWEWQLAQLTEDGVRFTVLAPNLYYVETSAASKTM